MIVLQFIKSGFPKVLLVLLMPLYLLACSLEDGVPTTSATIFALGSLSWEAPTFREDGITALPSDEIGGYRIYYGTTSGDYQKEIDISDVTAQFTLPVGTYYFVVTTYDTDGRESLYSSPEIELDIL